MSSPEHRIVVLLPMVFSVRNVVYSGVLDRLVKAGADVHLIFRRPPLSDHSQQSSFSEAAGCLSLLVPDSKPATGRALVNGVIGEAFSARNGIRSHAIYQRWFERRASMRLRARSRAIRFLGSLSRSPLVFNTLSRLSETMYRRSIKLSPVVEQLESLKPDIIWSTVCSSPLEYPYLIAARELGIPVVTSILSFDNLTSRPAFPKYDHYLVWNEVMRDQLLKFYPEVASDQVTITGTPQFDFHRKCDFVWTRSKVLGKLGLHAEGRYFLYAASHESLAPAETDLVSALAERMSRDQILRDYHLVVRLHPLDDGTRWKTILKKTDRLVLCTATDMSPDRDGWSFSSAEDQARLVSSMLHSEGCLNIVSTMTLDAAILDRPVIGINFSKEPDSPREIMYEEYEADHFVPLVRSGGLRLAHDWAELVDLMHRAIKEPGRDRRERRAMVLEQCGVLDGRASDRVAETLLNLLAPRISRTSTLALLTTSS